LTMVLFPLPQYKANLAIEKLEMKHMLQA